MRVFLDSSALAKRYIAEPGSEAVRAICRDAEEIVLSAVCLPEMISALNRLRREGKMGEDVYLDLKTRIQDDLTEVELTGLTQEVLRSAITCLERSTIRTLDAIHVATAKEQACDVLVSADRRQCTTAGDMGLCVVDLAALKA